MKSTVAHAVMFFYIYIVSFKYIPIGTRAILGILGLFLFTSRIFRNNLKINIDKCFSAFLIILSSIGFISVISTIYNGTTDFEFIKYVISIVFLIFSSYFLIAVLKKLNFDLCFKTISGLIVNVIFIQSMIALLMFTLPEFQDFIINIQRVPELAEQQLDVYKAYRVIGFGTMFFDAGIISGYALILIGMNIRLSKYTTTQLFFLSIQFLAITSIGLAMSRTTTIGALIGLLIVFIPKNSKLTLSLIKKRWPFLIYLTIVPVVIMVFFVSLYPEFLQTLEAVFSFAFEMFINYSKNGTLETDSSNVLKTLFIWPTDIKTYAIGDGYFSDPFGNGYYMHTDVGYLRLVYYFGVGGLGIFLFMQYFAISKAFGGMNISKVFTLLIFIYLLFLNLKGFADILSFTMLFWMYLLTTFKTKNSLKLYATDHRY